ncbi:hypothetical protein CsSME_00053369 [Camellia sinensis var. sinensis]
MDKRNTDFFRLVFMTLGILSTDKGQRALLSFDSYERSLIEVHCEGVNMELVQNFLLDQERKFVGTSIP